ncbi:ribosome small subunit-dependent GTPase A [Umboniibacter marinipuniceus]|uniref:Small ribosomal subunit biogenesis GTPase RsgA n=1 Tax=Umboniibacter marinipuniceus TaxID=569599 RepID=A0A3M0ABX6_9GAMM|nr:ribosome small subunit-dependent GTPase A [Umboniibacter marinipuniceus]RMA82661.1 ribosome biogenesis GTPase [Umboniibacter marinipuniceus]
MDFHLLNELGMRPFFQQQLSLDELENCTLGRVVAHHKSEVAVLDGTESARFNLPQNFEQVCVGDWVLISGERLVRTLERQSLFQRKAAGTAQERQLIAANVDSVFIVSSLNEDFSLNRIERYLVLAKEAGVEPVVVLTKKDTHDDPESEKDRVQQLDPLLEVHCINALAQDEVLVLKEHCRKGRTVAFLGSSGVGKSTLVNSLVGEQTMQTAAIRETDGKGRHTTTHRALKRIPGGGLLMDTPGMRELQLSDVKEGIQLTFAEIEAIAANCRFGDCQHEKEPGCAVLKAVDNDEISPRRLDNYKKLRREEAHNSATLAQRRAKDRAFTKMVNSVQEQSRNAKKFK